MKRVFKAFLPFLLLVMVEALFYYLMSQTELFRNDSFFFGWGVLWVCFLFYSLRGKGNANMSSDLGFNTRRGARAVNYATMSGASTESPTIKSKGIEVWPL